VKSNKNYRPIIGGAVTSRGRFIVATTSLVESGLFEQWPKLFNPVHDQLPTGIGVVVDIENQIVFILPSELTWESAKEASNNFMCTEDFVHRRMLDDPRVAGTSWKVEDFFGVAHLFSWRRHTYCEEVWRSPDGLLFATWSNDRSLDNPEGYVYDRPANPAVVWEWGNEDPNMPRYFAEVEALGIRIVDPLIRAGLLEYPKLSIVKMFGAGGQYLFKCKVHHYD
jgi:hypothetical protein